MSYYVQKNIVPVALMKTIASNSKLTKPLCCFSEQQKHSLTTAVAQSDHSQSSQENGLFKSAAATVIVIANIDFYLHEALQEETQTRAEMSLKLQP